MLFAICFAGGAWAATPVAVWDGDFSTMTKGTYTLSENGNTKTDSYLQISGNNGVLVTSTEALNVFTVIVRCSGLNLASANKQVLFTSYGAANSPHDNKTGVNLPANNAVCRGIWESADWNDGATQGSVPAKYTTLIYNHQQTNGTYAYALGPTSDVDDTVVRTTLYSVVGLRSSGTTYKGCAIGGLRGTTSATLLPATGLKITSIAVFSGTLTEAEMKSYVFPSEIQQISVDANTSVSAINALLDSDNYKAIAVSAADGVTITVDEAFGKIISVSSEGYVILAAASQPAASYFSGVDFSGVQGALVRSWITTNVVGFNFRSNKGSDVSGALVTADSWIHDSNSANGTSTAMFADGLSTLTWASSTTYYWNSTTILDGYLDDGIKNGNGAEVHLANVPYETYDIILYCSSDQGSGKHLAKTVNGTTYTWDSTENTTVAGNGTWGQTQTSTPAYGTNALRIKDLTGPLTIYGTPRDGSNRGGIAAFEIVNKTHIAIIDATGDYTLAGLFTSVDSSDNYVINVNESATLNLDSAVSVGRITFNVAEGKTLTLGGSNTVTASNGIYVKGGTVAMTSSLLRGTVYGNGTLYYNGVRPTTTGTDVILTNDDWHGTVRITYNYLNTATSTARQLFPQHWGGANSKILWNGVAGYFGGCTSKAGWILEDFIVNATTYPALRKNDGGSSALTKAPSLEGDGEFADASNPTERFLFNDGSAYRGAITISSGANLGMNVQFGATAESVLARAIDVLRGAEVTVAAGKTWTAPGGITVAGTLNVGAGATIPAIATGSNGSVIAAGAATINGVIGSAISTSLTFAFGNLSVVDTSVTTLAIPADTTPAAETFHPYMGTEKLDLTGCTSLTTLELNLGASTTFDLSKVLLPSSCTTVKYVVTTGSLRDLSAYTAPTGLGTLTWSSEFTLTETRQEYANGTFSVSNVPSGATVTVTRADGTTSNAPVTDGTARLSDYGDSVKISGVATMYDATFNNSTQDPPQFTYKKTAGAAIGLDTALAPKYNNSENNNTTGLYLRHHPYVNGATSDIHGLTDFTLVVVGQMSPTHKTQFIHVGSTLNSNKGLLIATTENDDEVIIVPNTGKVVDDSNYVKVTVPNAASARHAYVIIKSGNVFTVWVDGIKRGNFTVSAGWEIGSSAHAGVQVGSDFGGEIQRSSDADKYSSVANSLDETGVVNVIRIFDYVITDAQAQAIVAAYPYVSEGGLYTRTISADANLSATDAWAKTGSATTYTLPEGATVEEVFYNPSATVTVGADATLMVNADLNVDTLTVEGGNDLSVVSDGTHSVHVSGAAVVNSPLSIAYGAIDLAGTPVQLGSGGSLHFDCSAIDISGVFSTQHHQLTGLMDRDDTKVTATLPTAAGRTATLTYHENGYYELIVAPDHTPGTEVYYKSGYFGKGGDSPFTVVLSDGTTPTVVFEGDTVVIDGKSSQNPIYVGELPDNVAAIRVARTCSLASGNASNAMLDGAVVTVADGVVLTIQYNYNNINLGTVAFNKVGDEGTGSVALDNNSGTLSISGAVTGTAPVAIASGKTVTVAETGSIANAINVPATGTLDVHGTFTVNANSTFAEGATVTGDGRMVFEGALPSSNLKTSFQNPSTWTGAVELKNYTHPSNSDYGIIKFNDYGTSSSAIALNNVTSTIFAGNTAYPNVTLRELEIGEGGWTDGSTGNFTIDPTYTADLTGHGRITITTGYAGTVKFIGDHTFDGSVAFGDSTGKQVAFMKTASDELPSVTARAIVVADGVKMSIASGKSWTAPGGIKLDGSLTVLTAEKASATSVTPTAYVAEDPIEEVVDETEGTTTYRPKATVLDGDDLPISDNQSSRGDVTVSGASSISGSGGAFMKTLTVNDGATLTYDPVITPIRVKSAPVFNGTGKLKLAARYAGVTCGKFHLVSYPSSASVSGTLANVIDSSSFAPDVSYTVTEETVGSYKQLVLKVGDYDTNAKPVSIAQFGDSITEGIWRDGYRGTPNYRIPLMQLLEAYGYRPEARGYRKVGSTDANGVPADSAYEYHTGISAQRIYTGLTDGSLRAGFMESIEAHLEQVGVTDIITLKIGTNDSLGGEEPDNMFEGWTNLVWKIVRMRPTSKIVVCAPVKIMKSGKETSESNAASLRTKIADYVDLTYEQGGFPNGQVTMINGFNIVTGDANYYLTDNIHPNWNGHLQLANGWFPAVTNAIESMTARAADAYTAQTVASAADVAELAAYRAGYVKLATFTNVWTKLSTWSESPYYYLNEAFTNTPMSRVAYFVARKTTASPDTRYVWVDMDADATTGTKLVDFGVLTSASVNGVVTNLHIYSNSSAIENVAPNVSGVRGTLMRTEKGVNKGNGISTDLVPDGPYGFDWNDSINGSGAWGVMNMARIFDGATPNNHRKLLAAQMLFDFNGFNGARQNALGIGDFAVHGPYNTPNGSVDHFNLNWTFSTAKDEMPTMDARALESGVIEIWGFVAMPNEGGTDAGYIDGTTAVITNTTSSVTVPAGATAVAVSFSTGDAITLTSESLNLATSGVTVYATDDTGAKTTTNITGAFKVTAGANNTYTVELDPGATVGEVSVTPEVDTEAETAPMAFTGTAPVFTVKTIPGLWYVVASGSDLESLKNGTPAQAGDSETSKTLTADEFTGTVQYYKVRVGPSKASVQ